MQSQSVPDFFVGFNPHNASCPGGEKSSCAGGRKSVPEIQHQWYVVFSVKFGQNVHSITDNDVWTLKPLCSQNASCEQMPRIYQHRSSASQSFVGPSGLLGPSVVNNRLAIDLK